MSRSLRLTAPYNQRRTGQKLCRYLRRFISPFLLTYGFAVFAVMSAGSLNQVAIELVCFAQRDSFRVRIIALTQERKLAVETSLPGVE